MKTYIGGKEKNKHSNKKLRAGRGGAVDLTLELQSAQAELIKVLP